MVMQRISRPMSAQRLADPHRAPNWREHMAHRLVAENQAPAPGHHDRDVTMLTHFYRRRDDCQTMHDCDRLAKAMPDVCSAVDLHEQAPAGVCTIVDALVLANQPRESIAMRAGVTAEAIAFFERAFFDVRDRLGDTPFIIESVIRLREVDPNSDQFGPAVTKLLAYYTGPATIDLLTIPRGGQWTSIRELASKLVGKTRILSHLRTICSEVLDEPRQKQAIVEAIEAIEGFFGPYGDESIPRTEEQLVEARRQKLDELLVSRMRGGRPPQREGADV